MTGSDDKSGKVCWPLTSGQSNVGAVIWYSVHLVNNWYSVGRNLEVCFSWQGYWMFGGRSALTTPISYPGIQQGILLDSSIDGNIQVS